MMRKITLYLMVLFTFLLFACDKAPKNKNLRKIHVSTKEKLPIESPTKAWLNVANILKKQSCVSSHGFDREAQDRGDAWLLIVKDKNPNPKTSCRQIRLIVDKNSGIVRYENK